MRWSRSDRDWELGVEYCGRTREGCQKETEEIKVFAWTLTHNRITVREKEPPAKPRQNAVRAFEGCQIPSYKECIIEESRAYVSLKFSPIQDQITNKTLRGGGKVIINVPADSWWVKGDLTTSKGSYGAASFLRTAVCMVSSNKHPISNRNLTAWTCKCNK